MNYRVYYSPKALQDLDDIWDYIKDEYYNSELAGKTVNGIIGTVKSLEEFPEIGAPLSRIIPIAVGYRFIVSGNYNIFYRLEKQRIYVDRILHKKRNYINVLFDL